MTVLDENSLIEAMEEGVFVTDSSGKIVSFNSSLLRILGVSEEELREDGIQAVYEDGQPVPKEDLPHWVTLRSSMPLSAVILGITKKNGGTAWVSINSRPLKRPNQGPHGVLCTVTDISPMKMMERLLRESEGKLRSFLREAPVGILVTNEVGGCTFVNKTWCEMSSMPWEDCLGQGWLKAIHEDDAQEVLLARRRLTHLGHQVKMEFRFKHPDDSVVWVTVKAAEMKDDSGEKIGYLWTASDVTERKKAEVERDRLFTISLDLLCLAGTDGYFKRVNPSFTRVFGWSPEELYSKPILEWVHPEDRLDTQEELTKLSNGYESTAFEARFRCKDGSWRWLSWNCPAPVDGVLYAVARDITERRLAQEALKRMAHTDQLTGLRNRATLMSQLSAKVAQAGEYNSKLAVMFIDLDGFKEINDVHGHDAGDIVIREVAARLSACVRRSDMVARLGGDEYVIVLDNASEEDAEQVALKILGHISEPLALPTGHVVRPHASIGVSIYPDHAESPEGLIKAADKAMYISKRSGGHCCRH